MKTRREAIKAAMAATAFVTTAWQAPPSRAAVSGAAQPGAGSVSVIAPDDATFAQLLDQNFPLLSQNPNFAQIGHTAVLVTNSGSRAVYGYRVKWTSVKAGEPPDQYKRRFVSRPTIQLLARQNTAQVQLLGAGETALVTRFFSWTSQYFQAQASRANFTAGRLRSYQGRNGLAYGFSKRAKNADSVSVALEAVAFPDVVVGPRKDSFARYINSLRNAEHDQALAISQAFQAQSSSASIQPESPEFHRILFAQTLSSLGIASTPTWTARSYAKSKKRFAERMRHLFNVDSSKAQSVLTQVQSVPRSSFTT
jgi:hypothetical protein